jgi:uncharacterized protein
MLDAWWVFSDQRTVAHLELDECRRLLATEPLGRIALSIQALPAVMPVFFHLSGNRVVFAVETDALYAALSDNIVAFEVDHIDVGTHEGWAVVAVGRSEPVFDAALAVHELHSEDVPSTAVRLIGINLDRLSGLRASGRRIDALQAPA